MILYTFCTLEHPSLRMKFKFVKSHRTESIKSSKDKIQIFQWSTGVPSFLNFYQNYMTLWPLSVALSVR